MLSASFEILMQLFCLISAPAKPTQLTMKLKQANKREKGNWRSDLEKEKKLTSPTLSEELDEMVSDPEANNGDRASKSPSSKTNRSNKDIIINRHSLTKKSSPTT